MRAMKIMLRTTKPAVLPLAYNELVQGLLYSCWSETYPDLHNTGFGFQHGLKFFTFSPLQGKCSIDSKKKTIRFDGLVSFEVRTPIEELLDELAHRLIDRETIRLGAYEMKLENMQTCERLLFGKRVIMRAKSPVVVYRTDNDKHTIHYSPDVMEWHELIETNITRKAKFLLPDINPIITIIPKSETLRKHVTRFKGTYITGWKGDFIAAGDPLIISMLYYTGLGVKNSEGFGMFDILDVKP